MAARVRRSLRLGSLAGLGDGTGVTEPATKERTEPHPIAATRHHDVLIVGAGFSGLAMAIELKRRGRDFAIVDKADRFGGTWAANVYPGAACDVPSHLYQLSRRPSADWSRAYATQPEILAYLERVAAAERLEERTRLTTRLANATWDDEPGLWRVTLDGPGGTTHETARTLVLAAGMLHVPSRPRIEGLDDFTGPVMHTAEWRPDFEPDGMRLAVIGTGASAIQLVPALAGRAARVDLYQRSAPHVVEKRDRDLVGLASVFRRLPPLRAAYSRWLFEFHEWRHMVWRGYDRAVDAAEAMARRPVDAAIADPALRAAVTPSHRIGCQRILQSADYYRALARDDVHLVMDPIERVTERGIVADGTMREVDAVVLATGFEVARAAGLDVRGVGGRSLEETWREKAVAHVGTFVAGFPNLVTLLGPGTGLGHNSVVLMAEAQASRVARLLDEADRVGLGRLDVRADAQAAWESEHAAMAAGTVWGLAPGEGGCRTWYHDEKGRPTAVWPGTVRQFRRRLRRVGLADFEGG